MDLGCLSESKFTLFIHLFFGRYYQTLPPVMIQTCLLFILVNFRFRSRAGFTIHICKNPDTGRPVFTPATVASLLIFFVFALQCMSTLAIMRRETNTWRWPLFAFGYLLVLAYGASFVTYRIVGSLAI